MPLSNSQTRDLSALLHPYTNVPALRSSGPQVIVRGDGIRVIDSNGNSFIEASAGLWCAGLGFSDRELIEAAKEQLDHLPFYHVFSGMSHEPAIELAEKIKELAPGNMARVMFQTGGSEANDTQIKLVWFYNNALGRPQKKRIISRNRAYHGVTIATASLTGLPGNHIDFDLPIDRFLHTRSPHFWKEGLAGETETEFSTRLADELEKLILAEGPETVAAFIAEPVMGAGGIIVPPVEYFGAIQTILTKYDVLLIDDEVITGFGRTGNWFGAQTVDMQATSISMAKQLTAGYAPLSAIALNADMTEVIEANTGKIGTLGHGFTYGGHPFACAVGVKALEIYQRRNIVGHVRGMAPIFAAHLQSFADHPLVGEVRVCGLMGTLELVPNKSKTGFKQIGRVGKKFSLEMAARGVIVRNLGDCIGFCPPMIITHAELDEMCAPIRPALDATLDWVRAEKLE